MFMFNPILQDEEENGLLKKICFFNGNYKDFNVFQQHHHKLHIINYAELLYKHNTFLCGNCGT